jgi:thioredoxin 2
MGTYLIQCCCLQRVGIVLRSWSIADEQATMPNASSRSRRGELEMIAICPKCFKKNNLAAELSMVLVQCGDCDQPLWSAKPIVLNDDNFMQYVPYHEPPVLVDFGVTGSGPSHVMALSVQHIAPHYPQLQCAKVDTASAPQTSAVLQIHSIPSLILFKQNHQIARITGAMTSVQIHSWLAHYGIHK